MFDAFVQEAPRSYRRRTKCELGLGSQRMAQTGTVTFIQHFDSALRLTPHGHTLVLDGVYVGANAKDRDALNNAVETANPLFGSDPLYRCGEPPYANR